MSVIAQLFVVGEAASWWRFVCGEMVSPLSSLLDPVVQRFFRTEIVFVILILRLLISFQVQES